MSSKSVSIDLNNIEDGDLEKLYQGLISQRKKTEEKPFNPLEHKDKTRSTIAKIFVWSYFIGLATVFFAVLIYNLIILYFKWGTELLNVKDVILVFTSSVGSSLGFVVGYYFKGQEER